MPYIPASTFVTTDVTVVTTTETIVGTTPPISVPRNGCKVRLLGNFQLTIGASVTGVTLRWRRGTAITDTVIGEANTIQIATAAGSTEEFTYNVEDAPGDVARQAYVLTVQQVAATGNGTVLTGEVCADIAF